MVTKVTIVTTAIAVSTVPMASHCLSADSLLAHTGHSFTQSPGLFLNDKYQFLKQFSNHKQYVSSR